MDQNERKDEYSDDEKGRGAAQFGNGFRSRGAPKGMNLEGT